MDRLPSIVVCMCDQLRAFEVGCYGNTVIRTPHIDRLAREGICFEHAVTNNPVCMPARSCLLSGQYSRTCMGSLGNFVVRDEQGKAALPEYPVCERVHLPERTLPEQLKTLGYDTALIGKWHVHPAPQMLGFDYSLYPRVHHRHTGQLYMENGGPEFPVDGYSVEFEADRVARYVREHTKRPFFLFYNISPPHMPLLDAPETYRTLYRPEDVPLRLNVYQQGELARDEHWLKTYLWDFLYYQENLPYTRVLPPGFDLRHLVALYYGMTTWVDDMVGRLMASLASAGLADRTIVVFVSDHGDNLGSHHAFNKSLLIEEAIRIPLIFHSPGLLQAQMNHLQVAQMIDIMPTLLDLCDAAAPPYVQGRSLAPILRAECDELDRNEAFVETDRGQIGLRTRTHLYGMQLGADLRTVADDRACFYDLARDPYEQQNLARQGDQQALVGRLV
jgi:arylsulfatase A-like enzyme